MAEKSQAIHGNKSQKARQDALNNFKELKQTRILFATDIAARGIDIEELSHVINYELPNMPEWYVHRIGRTGRAGSNGIAMVLCDASEKAYLKDIQKFIGKQIPVINEHSYPLMNHTAVKPAPRLQRPTRSSRNKTARSSRQNNSRSYKKM